MNYTVTNYTTYRNIISFINLELSWLVIGDRNSSGEQVEKSFEQVQIVTSNNGDLKDEQIL